MALFRLFLIMLFYIVCKNFEQMTRLFCEAISIVWGKIRTLLLLNIYSSSVLQIFFFLAGQAKSDVEAGVTGKIPQNEVYFFKAFNMDDKAMESGLRFFLTVEENMQMSRTKVTC